MATQKNRQNFLRLAVVLVPAVIFITYYLIGLHNRAKPTAPVHPPALAVSAGSPVNLGGYSFQAGKPAPYFSRTISEPGNTIMAPPGQTFIIVPVTIEQYDQAARPPGLTWQIVDDAGTAHSLITPKDLLVPASLKTSAALNPLYLVFTLPDKSQKPFILLNSPWGQAAWRLKPQA